METAQVSRRLRGNRTAFGIYDHVVRIDADLMQHCSHQRRFVLAISVMMGEHFRSGMRLPSADSQLDRHVPNVPLREIPEGLHLRKWSARRRRQRRHFLFEFWRSISPSARQTLVPNSHLFPVLKSLVL